MAQSGDDQLFNLPAQAPEEVREFLDQKHRRVSIAEGGQLMMNPGQVLTNIENTMRRVDADVQKHISIGDDIGSEKEFLALMGELMMGPFLTAFLVNTGMQIMQAGGYPSELVTKPLPDNYDLTAIFPELTFNPRPHQVAKSIFDRRSTSTEDLTVDNVADDLDPLDTAEQIEVFIVLFYMWGTKIGAMKDVTGAL